MVWIWVIVGGLLAGIIAKAIVPGNEPSGFIVDAIIGIVGGILGKIIMGAIGFAQAGNPIWNLVVAVIGAVILLLIYHAIVGSGRRAIT